MRIEVSPGPTEKTFSKLQSLARNRGFWYLASAVPLAVAGRAIRPPVAKAGLYWCALSCAYVASGYLLPSNRLLFKSSTGRIPNALKVLLFPFFLSSNLYNWQARMRDSTAPFHEIRPGLFLGRRLLASDRDALREAGIDAVLDVTVEYDALKLTILGEDVAYLNIPVFDHGVPSLASLHKGVLWIEEQLKAGRKVIVHCALGRGRSATALMAYLIYCDPERSLSELVTEVRESRPSIAPNYRQLRTLTRYRASTLIKDAHTIVDLIINPTAGKGDHEQNLKLIRDILEPSLKINVRETSKESSAAELAKQSIERGVKTILAAGGDGTVSAVASQLAGTDVELGVIPLGTANAVATCLYGNQILTHGIEHACREILDGRCRKIDVARINGRLMVLMAGIGFDRQMVESAEGERKRRWGVLGYLMSGVEAIGDVPLVDVTLTVDGKEHRFKSGSVVIANMAPFFSILARGGGEPQNRDGFLDITWIVSEEGAVFRALSMLDLVLAESSETASGEGVHHALGREIVLQTNPPTPVTVDGEICMETPVRIEVLPAALNVICSQGRG